MSRQKLFSISPYQQMNKTEICLCATFQTTFRHPLHTVFVFLCFHINIFYVYDMAQNRLRLCRFLEINQSRSSSRPETQCRQSTRFFLSKKYFMQRKIGKPGEKAKGSLRLTFDYVLFEKASLSRVSALPKFTSSSHHSCGNGKEHKK